MEVSKATTEVYRLKSERDFANIFIDSADGATHGTILIHSSYGHWSKYWGACGERFKCFLVDLDIHYAATKFGCGNYFDVSATIEKYKADVNESQSEGFITPNRAAYILNEIENLDGVSENEFYKTLCEQERLLSFYQYEPPTITGIEPSFKAFWDEFWQPFCDFLKTEPVFEQPKFL